MTGAKELADNVTRITTDNAIDAVQIILHLAEEAERDGRASILQLGRPAIDQICELADEIKANTFGTMSWMKEGKDE